MSKRPLSITHLVLGLVFLGISVLWAVGAGTDAKVPDLAAIAPAVLIAAGVIGLIGVVVNARRRDDVPLDPTGTDAPFPPHPDANHHDGPGVVHEEESR
jgi:hypothetical protein